MFTTDMGAAGLSEVITRHLPTDNHPLPLDDLTHRTTNVDAWTTWHDLATTVTRQHRELTISGPSIAASITRLTRAIIAQWPTS